MTKRLRLIACLLAAALLTGCSAVPATNVVPVATLPPATVRYAAPVDDSTLNYIAVRPLYLPSLDRQRLLCQYESVALNHDRHDAESLIRALLAHEGNSKVASLGDGVRLTLYGDHPVEVAAGVCTVNLGSSALMLQDSALYTACLAIASTLCELDDISSVNVLIADQAVGMDITLTLPLGVVKAHPGEELTVLWEQMEARRTPLGEDPSLMPVTATATLFFPLKDASGVIPETRNITFPGQSPQQLAAGLLSAMSAGAQYMPGVSSMPDMNSLMVYAPQVSDMTEGGRLVTLHFVSDLEHRLAALQLDQSCFMAAIVETLTTFVPSVTAVRIHIGANPITSLYNGEHGSLLFPGGILRRSDFAPYLMTQSGICLASGQYLTRLNRTMPTAEAVSPRALLMHLMNGPTQEERDAGIQSVLPEGLSPQDVLGVAIDGDTLILNLSLRFADKIRLEAADYEQQLCYAMVNTLCQAKGLRRVVFFFGGEMVETLGGDLYWGGEFLLSPGMNEPTKG